MADEKPLYQKLYGVFYDVFRAAGIPLAPNRFEQVEDASRRLAKVIEAAAREANPDAKALNSVSKLAEAMERSFKVMEASVSAIEKRLDTLEKNQSNVPKVARRGTNSDNKLENKNG